MDLRLRRAGNSGNLWICSVLQKLFGERDAVHSTDIGQSDLVMEGHRGQIERESEVGGHKNMVLEKQL